METKAKDIEIIRSPEEEDIIFPAGDLYSDEPPLETYLHLRQMILLLTCLEWWWRDTCYSHTLRERTDFFAAGNLTIYYSQNQLKSEDFRGPDFFVVLDTERKPRKSWVVWEEGGKYPHVIVEILSRKTAAVDRGLKKQIFQNIFRTPNYFWFDPDSLEFCGFHLVDGSYQAIQPDDRGWLWSQQLGLYLGVHQSQLRLFTSEGALIPTPQEAAEQAQQRADSEQQRAEQEQQRAEQERQRAEQLANKLREMGIEP